MKKFSVLLLAAVMLFALTACTTSSTSTTTVTTTVNGQTTTTTTTTDENGVKTTETTTTDENGVQTTETADSGESDSAEAEASDGEEQTLSEIWHGLFYYGAEGESEAGNRCLFAYDSGEDMTYGAMLILFADEENPLYAFGNVEVVEGEGYIIHDLEGEINIPFQVSDLEEDDEDGFQITFQDGEAYEMVAVDQETIISDMTEYIH